MSRLRFAAETEGSRRVSVVVAGLTLNGATVLRRLVHLGYAAYGVSFDERELGWHVGGASHRLVPDPRDDFDAWVDSMLRLAEGLDGPVAALPMSDVYVVAFDRAEPLLRDAYRLHGFGRGLRTSLTSKRRTFELAERYDFPRPRSRWIETRDQLAVFAEELDGPALVKPDLTYHWRNPHAASVVGARKVITGEDLDDLLSAYDEVASFSSGLLAQEVIPGSDDRLVYWCGFVGPEGRVGGRLTGRKRRIVPIHFGSATFVELIDAPDVEASCERFLRTVGYQGLCGIELKRDPRDGMAKLIEINPRYGLWDDIGVPVGVDLAGEAVRSLFGAATEPSRPTDFRQKWVEITRDLPAAMAYRKESLLSVMGWLGSLRPPIVVNDLPIFRDPGYALHVIGRRLRKLLAGPRSVQGGTGGYDGNGCDPSAPLAGVRCRPCNAPDRAGSARLDATSGSRSVGSMP